MPSSLRQFCIHGHLYQPPREDPWLGRILIEASAAPMRHWNERIVAESYGPLGWAHRLDESGKILEICNCYEWMSFNVGPTLLAWLERRRPDIYARILEADAASLARWGHGNALAQVYHHTIMPLASSLDKELETAWAVADFAARFKRKPEGMWLAESAVDTATLETLAAAGILFVILAPRQARAVALAGGEMTPVSADFDVTRPYRVALPSGADMTVFFYDGPLSQAVAFERLLESGDTFWNRINRRAEGGLLTLATDGETYGHHFTFGEMALAHVLALGREGRDGLGLTNPGAYLAANPPRDQVLLHEPSSWSCAHGIERWRTDCGCKDGGHPDWNQRWRGPLRDALNNAKAALDEHFFTAGARCFGNAHAALRAYGQVLANHSEAESFAQQYICADANTAWKLLVMQERALAAFASCAWFFDDISRIEPVNGMTFMVRAMDLALETGGPELQGAFAATLSHALSNKPEEGTGADVLRRRVLPRRQDEASLCLLVLHLLAAEDRLPVPGGTVGMDWPAFSLAVTVDAAGQEEGGSLRGTARLGTPLERNRDPFAWRWDRAGKGDSTLAVTLPDGKQRLCRTADLPAHIRDYIALIQVTAMKHRTAAQAAATAGFLLSLMDPWEEAQTTVPHVRDWVALGPHLLAACVTEADVPDTKRDRAAAFCETLSLPAQMRDQAAEIVADAILAALTTEAPDWPLLTQWIIRAGRYLPGMNLWAVRNAFVQTSGGSKEKAALGEALGFVYPVAPVGSALPGSGRA